MRSRVLVPITLGIGLLAACGGAVTPAPTATPTTSASASATPATSQGGATANAWTVTSASKAVVSVREQLVGVSLPSDAVLTTTGAEGSFSFSADGTFTPDSKITFDLRTIASDERDRDQYVRQSTLQVNRFPSATFVPTKATGLSVPLPASGEFTFTLTGNMNIHGVTKEVAFDVTGSRSGGQLTATATAQKPLTFEDFGMRAPSVPFRVVSVNDEIKLVVTVVATGPAA